MPVALLLAGCQLAPDASCDFRPVEPRCQEKLHSVASETFKGTCAGAMFKASDGRCPTEGRVAGCDLRNQGDGSVVHDWYYPPETAESVAQICLGAQAGILEP
jgi:hypothetical protein